MNKFLRTLLILGGTAFLSAAAASGAAQDSPDLSTSTDVADAIKIVRISPPPSTILHGRDKAELVVHVKYALTSAPSAKLALIVQRQSARPERPVIDKVKVVQAGESTIEFREKLRIPKTNSLHVYVALQPDGTHGTSTVDHLAYQISND